MSNQQNKSGGRYDNYISINQRIQAAKHDIKAIITSDPVLFEGSNTFGYIRATIYLNDERNATAIASFRLDAQTGAQKTHPFEDAESSAVGRCLAFLGYHVDKAIASREEVEEAQRREAEYIEQEQQAKNREAHAEKLLKGRHMCIELIDEMRKRGLDPSLWPKWPYDRQNLNQLSIDELRAFYKWMDEQLSQSQVEGGQPAYDPEFDLIEDLITPISQEAQENLAKHAESINTAFAESMAKVVQSKVIK